MGRFEMLLIFPHVSIGLFLTESGCSSEEEQQVPTQIGPRPTPFICRLKEDLPNKRPAYLAGRLTGCLDRPTWDVICIRQRRKRSHRQMALRYSSPRRLLYVRCLHCTLSGALLCSFWPRASVQVHSKRRAGIANEETQESRKKSSIKMGVALRSKTT